MSDSITEEVRSRLGRGAAHVRGRFGGTRDRAVLAVVLVFGFALLAFTWWRSSQAIDITEVADTPATPVLSPTSDAERADLRVHVAGAVVTPGVYELPAGARGADAIDAAGGATGSADLAAVNLAAEVTDGAQLLVPEIGAEVASGAADPGADAGGSGNVAGLVNINTADVDALDTLPGVGEATALKIIEHRETQGRFRTVDDLLDVSGIGDRKLEDMRDEVTT